MQQNIHSHVILNAQLIPRTDAHIAIDDRGFRYGDGLFETIRMSNGCLFQETFHQKRLTQGAEAIHIPIDVDAIFADARALLAHNMVSDGVLRIAISRGVGGRGYTAPSNPQPTILLETMDMPEAASTPASLALSSYRKIPAQCLPAGHKLSQGLNSTLARSEATKAGYDEVLMLTLDGHLSESSSGNLFWIAKNTLYTPTLSCDCVNGSMRNLLMRYPAMPPEEVVMDFSTLEKADAIFLTNAVWPLWPVMRIEGIDKTFDTEIIAPIHAWAMEQIAHG